MLKSHQEYRESLERVPRDADWMWWVIMGFISRYRVDIPSCLLSNASKEEEISHVLENISDPNLIFVLGNHLTKDECVYSQHASIL